MAGWTGSGTFTRVYSWVADAAAGIPITASRMDTDTDNITTNGFNNCLTRDGQGTATANLPMNGFKFTNAGNGTAAGEYMTYAQVSGVYLPVTGGTVAALTVTNNAVVGGDLSVTGTTTLTGALSGGGATFSGNAAVTGTLSATGAASFHAMSTSLTYTANGPLVTTDIATFGDDATFNAAVFMNLTLQVGQGVSFGAALDVAGDVHIVGNAFANTFTPTSDARLKTSARLLTAEEGETWVRSVPGRLYQKGGVWEAGFFAQDIDAAGHGAVLALVDDPDMPASMNGATGPVGKRWAVPLGSADAYLSAALASALDKIAALTQRVATLETKAGV